MSYSSTLPTFPTNIITIQHALWITPSQLSQLVQGLSTVYFPIVDRRNTGFELLASLSRAAPFSVSPPVRFPGSGVYTSDINPLLVKLLTQLRAALAFKDRLINLTATAVTPTSSITPEYLAAFNSFYSALADLTDFSNNPTNYYDRNRFESEYSLTWS